MGNVRYFDWHFRPLPDGAGAFAIQAVTDDGRIVGQASLVNTVWAVTAEGRKARTYVGGKAAVDEITTHFTEVLAEVESKGEAAQ